MNKHESDIDKENQTASDHSETMPILPLPSLDDTAEQFTQWFTPLLTNEQRAQTRGALNAFIKTDGLGTRLHNKLEKFNQQSDTPNWLEEYWTTRFLAKHDPIAIKDNFFFLFRHREMDRTKRAAALIAAALNYKLVLDQGVIPTAVERSQPTCVEQTKRLFSTTRIPGEVRDHLVSAPSENSEESAVPRHIVVFCRGNIFQLELISKEGHPHALRDIEKGLEHIIDNSLDTQSTGRSIGHLTTLPRSDWARTRHTLINTSQTNETNLQRIDNALFSVHLDDQEPADNLQACDQVLHGDSGNRWFDKSLQFIIFNNGYAGLNVEHSGLDRATIVEFLDYVLGIDPGSIDQYSGAVEQGRCSSQILTFDLTPSFQKKIARAAASFDERKSSLCTRTLELTDFDIGLFGKNQISADAFAQAALQLAHWRLKQKTAVVGQNISMRNYASGRVQSMWSVTQEMVDFIALMLDGQADSSAKFEALKSASAQHETRILTCRGGELPQQHILELLNIYNRQPEDFQTDFLSRLASRGLSSQDINEALALFQSPGWTCMKNDAFNTRFLASPTLLFQGCSPDERGNISAGCLIQNDIFNVYLCADKNKKDFLVELASGWQQALIDLHILLRENTAKPDIEI